MKCNRCHHINPEDAVKCHNCGHYLTFAFEDAPTGLRFPPLQEVKPHEQKTAPQKQDKLIKWGIFAAIVMTVLFAMAMLFVLTMNELKQTNDPPSTYPLVSMSETPNHNPSDINEYVSGIHKYFYPYYMDSSETE